MNDDLPKTRLRISKEAADIITAETTSIDVCAEVDVSRYAYDDPYEDTADAEPFDPMFRARLFQELEDLSDPRLTRRLEETEVAERFGFDPDSVPRRSTFYRARTERFAELESQVETAAKQIRETAAEVGSPIGPELTPDTTSGTSERTKNRLIRQKMRELIDEVGKMVVPAFDLLRPDDAIYDDERLLELETVLGVEQSAANGGAELFGDMLDDDATLADDDPFYEDGPTGETLLEAVKRLTEDAISDMINRALARIFPRISPYEEFREPVMLAVDITYIGITVDGKDIQGVAGAPRTEEFDWCYRFATANIVGDNVKLPVAVLPVVDAPHLDNDAYPGQDKKYCVGNVMRNLLDKVTDNVEVRRVLADREFHAADVIAARTGQGLLYVIPAREDDRVKRFKRRNSGVTVKRGHIMHGPVKNKASNESVTTRLVLLPADEESDQKQVFVTNLDVDDEIGLDRRRTKKQIRRYTRRGGIEVAYKKIKEFGAWTTSMNANIRLFHFGFGVILYALWLLIDFLLKISLDEVEYEVEPLITAGQFRSQFRRRLEQTL